MSAIPAGVKARVIVGLGNDMMRDEGVGVAVAHALAAMPGLPDDLDVIDVGASSMAVLHAIDGREKAVIVDCALMDEAPGTLRRFTPDDVNSVKHVSGQSLHEGDVLEILRLSRELGAGPADVVVFGIQPERVEPGSGLSPILAKNMDRYVAAVCEEMGLAALG